MTTTQRCIRADAFRFAAAQIDPGPLPPAAGAAEVQCRNIALMLRHWADELSPSAPVPPRTDVGR